MKSRIVRLDVAKPKFPRIMMHKNETVVLFSSRTQGVALTRPAILGVVTGQMENWVNCEGDAWEPFSGTIEFSN